MGKRRGGRWSFQRPRGLERMLLQARQRMLKLLVDLTPWRWIIEQPGWRQRRAAWIYSSHWAAGERLEGRL